MSDLQAIKDLINARFDDVTDRSDKRFDKLDNQLDLHNGWLTSLWKKVNGSDPPPTLEALAARTAATSFSPPLDEQLKVTGAKTSSHDLDMHGLRSEIITLHSEMGEIRKLNEGQTEKMGVNSSGFSFLFHTREGRKFFMTAIAALTGLLTTAAATYAMLTGKTVSVPPPISAPAQVSPPPSPLTPALGPANPNR